MTLATGAFHEDGLADTADGFGGGTIPERREPMNTGFGAYFALFSEVGMVLLVTTLAGVAAGYWVDQQLGTQPLFVLVGFLAGAGIGAFGIYRLVTRFLKRFD